MSEPIGWYVYSGPVRDEYRLQGFMPNEPELSRVAREFADEVEDFISQDPA